uniref:Uncharacterized protein n=1 Tax=Arundo donax TaxID=35708 RepID=A0A0A9E8Z5_ARUDO
MLAVIAHATPMQHYILRELIFTILYFLHSKNNTIIFRPQTNLVFTLHSSSFLRLSPHLYGGSKSCLLNHRFFVCASSQNVIKHQGQHEPLHKLAPPGSLLLNLRKQRLLGAFSCFLLQGITSHTRFIQELLWCILWQIYFNEMTNKRG